MKRQLGKYCNESRYYSARVGQVCKFGLNILLKNVQCVDGLSQDNHVWVRNSKRFKACSNGDAITFRGVAQEYKRPSDSLYDFKIEDIREVKII